MTAGWYDSGVDQNCHQGCAAHDLISVEADMNSHLHEVDTNAKLKAMIAAVGGTTIAGACSSECSNNSDVPAWSSDACYIPNGKRSVKIEDCARVAFPLGHGKRRLCYCSNKGIFTVYDNVNGGNPVSMLVLGPGQSTATTKYPGQFTSKEGCEKACKDVVSATATSGIDICRMHLDMAQAHV